MTGLSYIELLVFCALIGIIAAISVPSTYKPELKQILKQEAQKLAFTIENLSLNTRQSEAPGKIRLERSSYSVESKAPTQLSHGIYQINQSVTVSNAPLEIEFYKSGVTSPVTIDLAAADLYCQIKLSLRSRVRTVCSW